MGMSASQVRLLTLQDRKSTIGLRLGSLATQKRMLNRQMTKLANDYNTSFSSKKLQWYDTINNDYTDITYANLMTPSINNGYKPFILTDRASGKVILDSVNAITNSPMHSNCSGYSVAQHMEELTGYSANAYIPGSQTLTQDMEFYIIEDMIGVRDFNRYKMRYTPIENLEKSYPKVNHININTLLDDFTAAVGENAASHTTGFMYLNGKGDSYNYFNEQTLWKSAYDANAVVQLNPDKNDNTIAIVRAFVDDLLSYKPIANLESVSKMAADGNLGSFKNTIVNSVMKVVFAKDNNNVGKVFEPDVSNVDTVLNYKLIEDSEGNKQVAYYSNRVDDPIQNQPEEALSINDAAVPQANATTSVIKVAKTNYDKKGNPTKDIVSPEWTPGEDSDNYQRYYYYISVANLMDVAMYYLSINLEEAESHNDDIYEISENGTISKDAFYPNSYANSTKMSVYEAGEVSVPSMYSVYSNLNTINSKLENITAHIDMFPEWSQNDFDVNTTKINQMRDYLKSFIDGATRAKEFDLIGVANMNVWLAQALTCENPSEFSELINKAYSMYQLVKNANPEASLEEKWETAQQNAANSQIFHYDNGVTNYDKREYLFKQNSNVRAASSEHDITSQLNADELNKFEFYKKLVKECLARGWAGNENVTDKSYMDAALTNGKWLIDDDIASNSRRVYEVTNDDVIDEAHSKYESQLTLITSKEEKIDREMSSLETQQNAINTELEGLKRVINDNIQSTFKIMV